MQLTLEIPDKYIQGQNQTQTAQQIKLYAALLMFQSGQLSRGAACEFAGVVLIFMIFSWRVNNIRLARLTSQQNPSNRMYCVISSGTHIDCYCGQLSTGSFVCM